MNWNIEKVTRDSHIMRVNYTKKDVLHMLVCSDAHWDNPLCQRDILKRHLDQAVSLDAPVIMPGDTFCLMQGKYDKRSDKSSLRPEHATGNYLDSIVKTAAEWFRPYQNNIALVCLGNHETAIRSRKETDIVERFVERLNVGNEGKQVQCGDYRGWLSVRFKRGKYQATRKIHYFHGAGGGGPVTGASIRQQREMAAVDGADVFVSGHVHELQSRMFVKWGCDQFGKVIRKKVISLVSSTYKDEAAKGHGWHVERGAPAKPIGGWWLKFKCYKDRIETSYEPTD